MEVEGVNNRASRLVVVVIDGHSGQTASDLPLLEHIHLDLWAKVLPQKMGCCTASYPRTDHSWRQRSKGCLLIYLTTVYSLLDTLS